MRSSCIDATNFRARRADMRVATSAHAKRYADDDRIALTTGRSATIQFPLQVVHIDDDYVDSPFGQCIEKIGVIHSGDHGRLTSYSACRARET